MLRSAALLAALLVVLAAACAPRTSTTTWGASSWSSKSGGGGKVGLKRARSKCLEQAGIADAESVEPNSAEENRFLRCMNSTGWCTYTFKCGKAGT
ncbi:MAG: hypothetical protein QNK04_16715 [Myxococcota bacterium]|nr:hypothetical protein [Myxococcota bacterium]